MKNQNHTPGPWTTENCTDGIVIESGEKYIADVHYHIAGAMSAQETQANAALIAAAPEMLEALSRVFNECRLEGCTPELNDLIVLALKKARGES